MSDIEMLPESRHQSNSPSPTPDDARNTPFEEDYSSAAFDDDVDISRKDEWMNYARPIATKASTGGQDYLCIWENVARDGTKTPCKYTSKKHLVKRHIESKHMGLRYARSPTLPALTPRRGTLRSAR